MLLTGLRRPRVNAPQLLVWMALSPVLMHAQTPSWPIDGPAFKAAPEAVQKAAAAIPAENFMQATVLYERSEYVVDATGRLNRHHSMIYRIETPAGVEGWSETSIGWDPWYQNEPQIHVRVIRTDGTVTQLDQKTITDGPAKEQDEETYTDARIRKAPLPGLAVGAIVEEETVLEDKSPFFAGGSIYRDYVSRNVPVIRTQVLVQAPPQLKLQYRVHSLPNVVTTDKQDGGFHTLTFDQAYQPGQDSSDINLASHKSAWPMVEFSTGESWASVADSYRQLAEVQIDPAAVKSFLPPGLSTKPEDRLATIQKIVSRLHKDVRYTGIEFGESSLKPQTAAEVIKRHYGDCKDKAAILVAMLRAAGISANMALLDAGQGVDVTPELPGMNQFDHAIVYLPAGSNDGKPLWIDATAEYSEVGTLPSGDRDRQALIIAEGTNALTTTPALAPEEDKLIEHRDFVMSEHGMAHITETSYTHGAVDASYRSDFGAGETKEGRANLEGYAKAQYLAKALTKVERGDGKDFSKPFVLRLDMAEARRGDTGISDASFAIPFSNIFSRLPSWFRTDPRTEGEKLTPQEEENLKKKVAARLAEYDVEPFITEWRYAVTPPAGFVLRALPEDKSIEMGPARFQQHFEAGSNGIINAVLTFNTVKPRYTLDEVLALRKAVLASYKQDMIVVLFDEAGSKLIAAGHAREGLDADRALIAKQPNNVVHHAQFAYALLDVGMGDRAIAEAKEAARLDPKSAVAQRALGWTCQFSPIGVQFGRGFDHDCAQKGYAKAKELDPDDMNTRLNLAIIEEYNAIGDRYAEGSMLKDAVREYKEIREKDKQVGEQYEDNLLFDLLFSGQYKELLAEVEKLPSTVSREGLAIAAAVAAKGGKAGADAGIQYADHLGDGAQQRSSALATAGNHLLQLRLYPEAADILSAAAQGQSDSAHVADQVALFRNLTPWKNQYLSESDPRSVVQRVFMSMMSGEIDTKLAANLLSRNAYDTDAEWNRNLANVGELQGLAHQMAKNSGMPTPVLLDLMAGNLKLTSEGDASTGYRISVQSLGAAGQHYFVTKDEAGFRVVTDGNTFSEAGNEVLHLLHAGREAEARSLLDWERDQMHKGGGDDALSGPIFPRFWTSGDTGNAQAMQLAAAALLAYHPRVKELLPLIRAARDKETSEEQRINLSLLLAQAAVTAEDGALARPICDELLKKYPDSIVALNLAGGADVLIKNLSDWDALIDVRLKKHPQDEALLRMRASAAEWEGKFDQVRASYQVIFDSSKATANDYNAYAWTGLFDHKVDADIIKAGQQSVRLNNGGAFPELHTLACLYAFQGKTKEARELLLKAMDSAKLSQPNSAAWFAFGSIYEDYGIKDAAIDAFSKVEKPDHMVGPTDTWVLAQEHLKALKASAM